MRIFVQQLMVIVGGILFFVLNNSFMIVGLLLIILKSLADSTIIHTPKLVSGNEKEN